MAGASWLADLNTDLADINVISDVELRLRVLLARAGDNATTPAFKWQYNKNSGGWTDITASSSDVATFDSSEFADGDDCAEQLLGSGTLITNNDAAEESTGTFTMPVDFTAGSEVEAEIALQLQSADLAHGDTLEFRIVEGDGTALDTYTQTPSIDVVVQQNIIGTTPALSWTSNTATVLTTRGVVQGNSVSVTWTENASVIAGDREVVQNEGGIIYDNSADNWVNGAVVGFDYNWRNLFFEGFSASLNSNKLRITLHAHATEDMVIENFSFGHKADDTSTDAAFSGSPTPVRITFDGQDSVTVNAGVNKVSDIINYAYVEGTSFIIGCQQASDQNRTFCNTGGIGQAARKETTNDESLEIDPSGYSFGNALHFVEQVEALSDTAFSWIANTATVVKGISIAAGTAELTWTPEAATIIITRSFTADTASIFWSTNAVTINRGSNIAAGTDTLSWSTNSATIGRGLTVGASTAVASWTANAAAVNSGASWFAAKNQDLVDHLVNVDSNLRLRIEILNSGAAELNPSFKFQYRKNAGSWTDIHGSSSDVRTFNSSWFIDGDDCSEQLLGSGTFISNNDAAEDSTGVFTLPVEFSGGSTVETEIAIRFESNDLSQGDTLEFRVVKADGIIFGAYTEIPTVTVNLALVGDQDIVATTDNLVWSVNGASVSKAGDLLVIQSSSETLAFSAISTNINTSRLVNTFYFFVDWYSYIASVERAGERFVATNTDSLEWSTNQATVPGNRVVAPSSPETLAWTENQALVSSGRGVVQGSAESLTWTENVATATQGRSLIQTLSISLNWLEKTAIINKKRQPTQGASIPLDIEVQISSVSKQRSVDVSVANSLVWSVNSSVVVTGADINIIQGATATKSWTENAANINRGLNLLTNSDTKNWTKNKSNVLRGDEIVQQGIIVIAWTENQSLINKKRLIHQQTPVRLVWSVNTNVLIKRFIWTEEDPLDGSWIEEEAI